MPCRDNSGSLLANLTKTGGFKPFHLYRVPARGWQPIVNLLILMTKFCGSRIFTPGQARDKRVTPRDRLDRNALARGLDRV
jgi:hypothetical protein